MKAPDITCALRLWFPNDRVRLAFATWLEHSDTVADMGECIGDPMTVEIDGAKRIGNVSYDKECGDG